MTSMIGLDSSDVAASLLLDEQASQSFSVSSLQSPTSLLEIPSLFDIHDQLASMCLAPTPDLSTRTQTVTVSQSPTPVQPKANHNRRSSLFDKIRGLGFGLLLSPQQESKQQPQIPEPPSPSSSIFSTRDSLPSMPPSPISSPCFSDLSSASSPFAPLSDLLSRPQSFCSSRPNTTTINSNNNTLFPPNPSPTSASCGGSPLDYPSQHQHQLHRPKSTALLDVPPLSLTPTVATSIHVSSGSADKATRKKSKRRLEQYSDLIQQAIEQRAMHAQNCVLAERTLRSRAKQTLTDLSKSMLVSQIGAFRHVQHLRLCRIHEQREVALQSLILLKLKKVETQSLLDDPLGLHGDVPVEMFQPVNGVFETHPSVEKHTKTDQLLSAMHSDCEQAYTVLSRTIATATENSNRSRRLRSLLKNTRAEWVDSGVSFHFLDLHVQTTFDGILRNQGFEEGRLIHQVADRINLTNDTQDTLPQVMPFLQYLLERVLALHSIPKDLVPILRLYLARMFFPLIADKAFAYSHAAKKDVDSLFRKNQKWLRSMTESEIGVPSRFCSPSNQTSEYRIAAQLLEELSFHVVPLDILNAIREACRAMFQQAKLVAQNPDVRIDADSFFPILISACVQAELWDPLCVMHYLNTFTTPNEKVVEVGYYLTCVEGAAQYISEATPQSARMSLRDVSTIPKPSNITPTISSNISLSPASSSSTTMSTLTPLSLPSHLTCTPETLDTTATALRREFDSSLNDNVDQQQHQQQQTNTPASCSSPSIHGSPLPDSNINPNYNFNFSCFSGPDEEEDVHTDTSATPMSTTPISTTPISTTPISTTPITPASPTTITITISMSKLVEQKLSMNVMTNSNHGNHSNHSNKSNQINSDSKAPLSTNHDLLVVPEEVTPQESDMDSE